MVRTLLNMCFVLAKYACKSENFCGKSLLSLRLPKHHTLPQMV